MALPLEIEHPWIPLPQPDLRRKSVVQIAEEALQAGETPIILAYDGEGTLDSGVMFTSKTGLIKASMLDIKEIASIRDKLAHEH